MRHTAILFSATKRIFALATGSSFTTSRGSNPSQKQDSWETTKFLFAAAARRSTLKVGWKHVATPVSVTLGSPVLKPSKLDARHGTPSAASFALIRSTACAIVIVP